MTSDTRDGIITLTGHVRTWAEHDAVVGAARMALGTIDIRDQLHDRFGRCVEARLKMLADLAIGPNATQRSRTW